MGKIGNLDVANKNKNSSQPTVFTMVITSHIYQKYTNGKKQEVKVYNISVNQSIPAIFQECLLETRGANHIIA